MENSDIEAYLDEAQALFEQSGEKYEEGLDVDEPALLQLRKACRLLAAARHLRNEGGFYTVVVETSFGAIERTIQFYLLENDHLHRDEYVNHEEVYRRGMRAGLYDQRFAGKLDTLWRNNRSETYYREGIATKERARKMLDLADAVHHHVLQLAGMNHECICNVG